MSTPDAPIHNDAGPSGSADELATQAYLNYADLTLAELAQTITLDQRDPKAVADQIGVPIKFVSQLRQVAHTANNIDTSESRDGSELPLVEAIYVNPHRSSIADLVTYVSPDRRPRAELAEALTVSQKRISQVQIISQTLAATSVADPRGYRLRKWVNAYTVADSYTGPVPLKRNDVYKLLEQIVTARCVGVIEKHINTQPVPEAIRDRLDTVIRKGARVYDPPDEKANPKPVFESLTAANFDYIVEGKGEIVCDVLEVGPASTVSTASGLEEARRVRVVKWVREMKMTTPQFLGLPKDYKGAKTAVVHTVCGRCVKVVSSACRASLPLDKQVFARLIQVLRGAFDTFDPTGHTEEWKWHFEQAVNSKLTFIAGSELTVPPEATTARTTTGRSRTANQAHAERAALLVWAHEHQGITDRNGNQPTTHREVVRNMVGKCLAQSYKLVSAAMGTVYVDGEPAKRMQAVLIEQAQKYQPGKDGNYENILLGAVTANMTYIVGGKSEEPASQPVPEAAVESVPSAKATPVPEAAVEPEPAPQAPDIPKSQQRVIEYVREQENDGSQISSYEAAVELLRRNHMEEACSAVERNLQKNKARIRNRKKITNKNCIPVARTCLSHCAQTFDPKPHKNFRGYLNGHIQENALILFNK